MELDPTGEERRAAIYCRISRDRDGTSLGIERQEADCRALARRLGWRVVAVYADNDISAYSGKRRPGYDEMMKGVRSGHIRGVLAWHPDRLYRRLESLQDILATLNEHDLRIETVTAGNVDLSTVTGQMTARIVASVAQAEVEHTQERIRRKKQQAAEQGLYRGGRRPFGYEKDGVTVDEKEAKVIRDATKAVLAGRSLLAIARELQESGIVTSTGSKFTHVALREVLTRPRNAGLISKGSPGRAGFEILGGRAVWPAIVDEDEWRACFAVLYDPSRRTHRGTEPKWLGSSTYVCGYPGCTGTMRAAGKEDTKPSGRRRRQVYRCRAGNHLQITAVPTDDFVKRTVADLLRDPRLVQALATRDGDNLGADRERRRVLVMSREQTERDYDDDLIDARRYKAKSEKIENEIADIDARLAAGMQQAVTNPVLRAQDPGDAFLSAPVDIQRAVLREVVRVEVLPARQVGAAWSSDRLRLTPVVEGSSE